MAGAEAAAALAGAARARRSRLIRAQDFYSFAGRRDTWPRGARQPGARRGALHNKKLGPTTPTYQQIPRDSRSANRAVAMQEIEITVEMTAIEADRLLVNRRGTDGWNSASATHLPGLVPMGCRLSRATGILIH